jgi:leucine dehydrogenase
MSLFDSPAFENHEAVHFFNDAASGLKAIIAIHSTARGPAAGGCRMFAYPDDQAAIDDALRLSRAMSHKNAVADLDLGGGKAVIIGDPRAVKSGPLFEAFGAAVKQLGGRYWSAEDVGVSPSDLAHARRKTKYVAGLEGHPAASGDPSPVTAEGVKRGIALCVRRALGRDLDGISVAIQGVGHVGAYLAQKLAAAGASLTITDVDEASLVAVAERTGARIVAPDDIFDVEAEVFAPCAMGGAITRETIGRLKAKVVAGGANNQLGEPDAGALLESRGVLYAPDFVINGGGIINVAGEIRALRLGEAFDPAWVAGKLDRLMETLGEVLDRAKAERRTPQEVAVAIAEARIAAVRVRA